MRSVGWVRKKEGETGYRYDRRGNLTTVTVNGSLQKEYLYGALNRLEEARDVSGEVSRYYYNGLGHRVGQAVGSIVQKGAAQVVNPVSGTGLSPEATLDPVAILLKENFIPAQQTDFVIDLTREYHNLLQKKEAGTTQTYLWDGNVAECDE